MRGYQRNFSSNFPAMYSAAGRERKAEKMVRVLEHYFKAGTTALAALDALDVGASTGIIDSVLAEQFRSMVGIDIDEAAIEFASEKFVRDNLRFQIGDAQALPFGEDTFDVVICSQVYEHVPDAAGMLSEVERVLKPGGVCYFAANNRFMIMEPHYQLAFLSWLPKPLADRYMRWAGKGDEYYERHVSYWGLRKLTRNFQVHDYTGRIVSNPDLFGFAEELPPGSAKQRVAKCLAGFGLWAFPGYVWLLEKRKACSAA